MALGTHKPEKSNDHTVGALLQTYIHVCTLHMYILGLIYVCRVYINGKKEVNEKKKKKKKRSKASTSTKKAAAK